MMYGVLTYLCHSDGKVLMIRKLKKGKDPNSGLYTLPGGKLEPEEKSISSARGRLEAAVRETEQETGIHIIKPEIIGAVLFDNNGRIFDNWSDAPNYLVHIIASHSYTGKLLLKGDSGEIPFWEDKSLISELPQSTGDALIYSWIDTREPFMGVIRHKGKEIDKENSFVDKFSFNRFY